MLQRWWHMLHTTLQRNHHEVSTHVREWMRQKSGISCTMNVPLEKPLTRMWEGLWKAQAVRSGMVVSSSPFDPLKVTLPHTPTAAATFVSQSQVLHPTCYHPYATFSLWCFHCLSVSPSLQCFPCPCISPSLQCFPCLYLPACSVSPVSISQPAVFPLSLSPSLQYFLYVTVCAHLPVSDSSCNPTNSNGP